MTDLITRLENADGAAAVALTNQRQFVAWAMIGLFFVTATVLLLFGFWWQATIAWISTMAFWIASRIEAARHEIVVALLKAKD